MFALTLETAKKTAIIAAVVLVALAVISAWIVKNVTVKIVMILLLAGLALGFYTQRHSLETCADKVKARATAGDTRELSCKFFGFQVKVPIPTP